MSNENSPVIQETLAQVVALLRQDFKPLGSYRFVAIDENTLRVNKGGRNVDIRYDAVTDLYDVQKHTINQKTFDVATTEHKGLFADQLGDALGHLDGRSRKQGLAR